MHVIFAGDVRVGRNCELRIRHRIEDFVPKIYTVDDRYRTAFLNSLTLLHCFTDIAAIGTRIQSGVSEPGDLALFTINYRRSIFMASVT